MIKFISYSWILKLIRNRECKTLILFLQKLIAISENSKKLKQEWKLIDKLNFVIKFYFHIEFQHWKFTPDLFFVFNACQQINFNTLLNFPFSIHSSQINSLYTDLWTHLSSLSWICPALTAFAEVAMLIGTKQLPTYLLSRWRPE